MEARITQPDPKFAVRARAKKQGSGGEESDDRNSEECLSLPLRRPPSLPSKYLAVHLLIILSRLLEEEGDPTAAALLQQQLGGPLLRWKKERREGAIRRGIRKWPSSNGCTMHSQKSFSLHLVQIAFLSSFGTFPQTEKRVRQRQRTKEGGIDKNRVVSSSAQFQLPTNPWPYLPVSAAIRGLEAANYVVRIIVVQCCVSADLVLATLTAFVWTAEWSDTKRYVRFRWQRCRRCKRKR